MINEDISMFNDNMDFVNGFEKKLCDYTGFRYSVATDCCTNALLITLELLSHLGKINKKDIEITIPRHTYLSVPMTLKNNGWNIKFSDIKWCEYYQILNINDSIHVYDSAVFFVKNMIERFELSDIVCVSFQQKKRLPLGRGGAVLFNDDKYFEMLKRLRYDGRFTDVYKSDTVEINETPDKILCGFHCYMEPDKAANGILKLNQESLLLPYIKKGFNDYPDISKLKCFED